MHHRALSVLILTMTAFVAPLLQGAESHGPNQAFDGALKKLQVSSGWRLEGVAQEPLLQNPVSFSIDPQGRFYVVETFRFRHGVFDITENTPWLLDDLSFRDVGDRIRFLDRTFATNLSVLTAASERLRLVEDMDGDGLADHSTVLADGFNDPVSGIAAGVLAHGTNVWFACIPDLWRFTASAPSLGDSRQPEQLGPTSLNSQPSTLNSQKLLTGLGVHIGVSGHDAHGLILGPDGRLYFSFGDRGLRVTNREGAVIDIPDTGGVLRGERDGRGWEPFCWGLRNPQELAFDDEGNLWTVDNDTAGADPCRVLHLVEGMDYGWRTSYQHMKGFGPWVQEGMWRGGLDGIPAPAGTVSQGPAGLAYYPGTGLGDAMRGRFVHADFPGGIWTFTVRPRGASFELAEKEKLLWNCWPTDVDFGPDGALYVLDWVQGWQLPQQGRIYRLTRPGEVQASKAAEVKRWLAEGMAGKPEQTLTERLGHTDRRVRMEAQFELAARGRKSLNVLLQTALRAKSNLARPHALWAIGQIARTFQIGSPHGDLSDELVTLLPLLDDADETIRGTAAQLLAETALVHADQPIAALTAEGSARARFEAAMALGTLMQPGGHRGSSTGVQMATRWLEENVPAAGRLATRFTNTGFTFHPGAEATLALVHANTGEDSFIEHAAVRHWAKLEALESQWPSYNGTSAGLKQRAEDLSPLVRHAAVLAARRLTNAFITNLLTDPDPRVALAAARAINDVPLIEGYPRLASLLDDSRFADQEWAKSIVPPAPRPPRDQVLMRALNANFRLGGKQEAEALAQFAANSQHPEHLRAEALFLLGAWEVQPASPGHVPVIPEKDPNHGSVPGVNPEKWPGWFDRVVGLWRPLPPRSDEEARRAMADRWQDLLSDDSQEVAQAALASAVALRATNTAPRLLALLKKKGSPSSFRKAIPSALADWNAAELGEATAIALEDNEPAVRAAALPYLDRLRGDKTTAILSDLILAALPPDAPKTPVEPAHPFVPKSSDMRLAQAALRQLATLASASAETDATLALALNHLQTGTLPGALQLELLEATANRENERIRNLRQTWQTNQAADDPLTGWRAALEGGDAARGRTLFFEKVEVQCSRCHQIKGEGGTVGPALDGIGRRQKREYLLESILHPNQSIAAGFENVVVTLKDGTTQAGVVKGENDTELRLESLEDGPATVARDQIRDRQRTLSAMPEGLAELLGPRDLRDVVEFLATLE